MQKKITLAGREFIPVGESTVAHDIEVLRLLKVGGLEDPKQGEGEDPDTFGYRILQMLIERKVLLPLISCLIVPRKTPAWTPAGALETERFLASLDEPADKKRVYGLVAELLFPFLRDGLSSWRNSRRSAAMGLGSVVNGHHGQSAAATSGPGAPWSAN